MSPAEHPPLRVIACCGDMFVVFGNERMTFEVLRVLRDEGAAVHCIVNDWENERIVQLADDIGATWSTGYYRYGFSRALLNPLRAMQFAWEILNTSLGLLRDSRRFRPTHIFMPNFMTAIRNAPALLILRALGVPTILRVANHPVPNRVHLWLWSRVVPRLVDRIIAISVFCRTRLAAAGVPEHQLGMVLNRLATRSCAEGTDQDVVELVRQRRTVLVVGQVAPFKGTHLAIEACRLLIEAGLDLQLVIVGTLPIWPPDYVAYATQLQTSVAAAGLGDRVRFVGGRQNVAAIMRAGYILAAPIVQEETFGNVGLESTGAGLPPVIFPTGGLVESVVHLKTGFICRASTVEALVEGLRYFLDDPAARDAASAAGLAQHQAPDFPFSAAAFRRGWLDVFGVPRA